MLVGNVIVDREIDTVCIRHFALHSPLLFTLFQVHKQRCHIIHSVMECRHIKVMLGPCVADSWVLVNSNNVAHVEARSSLVGLWGSGWGHIQQAAPLEVDKKWSSKSLSWL